MSALLSIDPSRANTLADKIDMKGASDELRAQLLPIIVKNKITSQIENIAPLATFYPFIKFQDPELGKAAEDGFNWIMTSDNLKATESITKIAGYAKKPDGR